MENKRYRVEYILRTTEKGEPVEKSLGKREISVSANSKKSKEALAFIRADRRQLDANKLIITHLN